VSFTLLGMSIGFSVVVFYILASGYKKRALPDMAVVLFLLAQPPMKRFFY